MKTWSLARDPFAWLIYLLIFLFVTGFTYLQLGDMDAKYIFYSQAS